jgi:hypothetical protein
MHAHAEIRDLSLKTIGYAPSAVIRTHSIPRRAHLLSVSKIIRLASAALLALVIMGNISGFDSSVSSVNPQIPRVAQSKPVQEESTTSQQKTVKPVFAGDLLGYLHLCCSHREQKKRTSELESTKQIQIDLRPVFDALSAQG